MQSPPSPTTANGMPCALLLHVACDTTVCQKAAEKSLLFYAMSSLKHFVKGQAKKVLAEFGEEVLEI